MLWRGETYVICREISMSFKLFACASACIASLSICTSVYAKESHDSSRDENRDIIVTGTKLSGDFGAKSGIPIAKVPQSIQIVTADEIVEQGARSIGDLLRNVPSANPGFFAGRALSIIQPQGAWIPGRPDAQRHPPALL
ncbi:MAG: Plug domain-containing protein [Sphingomonadales bacterium]|nr:Plug domain-containing protein [Sphingomonadales bacterium]